MDSSLAVKSTKSEIHSLHLRQLNPQVSTLESFMEEKIRVNNTLQDLIITSVDYEFRSKYEKEGSGNHLRIHVCPKCCWLT